MNSRRIVDLHHLRNPGEKTFIHPMPMRISSITAIAASLVGMLSLQANAQTLSALVATSDVVCLCELADAPGSVRLVGGMRVLRPATSIYNVIRVAKSPKNLVKPLDDVVAELPCVEREGGLYLLAGHASDKATDIDWKRPSWTTEDGFDYAIGAPPANARSADRAAYFAKFLNSADRQIAEDAISELTQFDDRDLAAIANGVSRDCILRSFAGSPNSEIRTFWVRMIAARGNPEDAGLFESYLSRADRDRHGLREMIVSYLRLAGEPGLDKIDQWIIKDPHAFLDDVHSANEAIWALGNEQPPRISKTRLIQSLRLFLDRPDADEARAVIAPLARWQDWSVRDRLMRMFSDRKYDDYLTRLEIVRYMFVALRSRAKMSSASKVAASDWAATCISELRRRDSALVNRVENVLIKSAP